MGVLDGIKILELARVPPAEMPAMMLADMGAEVLKIDSPDPSGPPATSGCAGPSTPSPTATSAR